MNILYPHVVGVVKVFFHFSVPRLVLKHGRDRGKEIAARCSKKSAANRAAESSLPDSPECLCYWDAIVVTPHLLWVKHHKGMVSKCF